MATPRPIAIDTLLLWAVVLLPSTGMMLFGAGSMSPGLLAASLLILAVEMASFGRLRTDLTLRSPAVRIAGVAAAAFVLHGALLTALSGGVDWSRLLGSLVAMAIVLAAASCMRYRLVRHSSAEVNRILASTTGMMLVLALRSFVGEPMFPPVSHPRPVVVFTEPSHFAFTFLPFAGYFIVQARGMRRILLAVAAVALGLALGSTTLLAGLVMLLITCLPWWQSAMFAVAAAGVGVVVGFDPTFIVNRIVFSEDIHNLSNLVLVQGWERAWLSLPVTHGLGLGFQQFGIWGPVGDVQELIFAINGDYINLYDGGTSGSKIVGEFGVAGILALIAFLRWWWLVSKSMRVALRGVPQPAMRVFMDVCAVAIGVELFIRGVGYLSQGLFLFGIVFGGPTLVAASMRLAVPSLHRPGFLVRLRRELTSLKTRP